MTAIPLEKLSLDELFEEFKQLPDWDKFPMPEVFYEHFHVKKPKPSVSIMDALVYTPPLSHSLNTNGKVELRDAAPGGVREIQTVAPPPVEVKKVNEETGELEDYPVPNPTYNFHPNFDWSTLPAEVQTAFTNLKSKIDGDTNSGSVRNLLSLPTADSSLKTPLALGPQ